MIPKCPHCGETFDARELRDGKVPTHGWSLACPELCPGSGHNAMRRLGKTCDECLTFRPGCASVRMRVNADGAPTDFRHAGRTIKAVLCGQCRKRGCYRGTFRLLARTDKRKAPTCD